MHFDYSPPPSLFPSYPAISSFLYNYFQYFLGFVLFSVPQSLTKTLCVILSLELIVRVQCVHQCRYGTEILASLSPWTC